MLIFRRTTAARAAAGLLWLSALSVPGASAWAGEPAAMQVWPAEESLSADLEGAGWKLLTLPGKPATRFGRGGDGIRVVAEDSVAFLYRPVPESVAGTGRLAWRWRVEEATPATDLSLKGRDDRPLALHVCFAAKTSDASLWERLGQAVKGLVARPFAGKVLTYVWGGTQARGAKLANPHLEDDGVIIVLRAGGARTGRWFAEEVDYLADFEMAFGYRPAAPAYIAISADSDDRGGRSRALVGGIRFAGG